MENRLKGISAAAASLGVSTFTIRRALARGEIKFVRVARRVLIPECEIARICAEGCGQYQPRKKVPARERK